MPINIKQILSGDTISRMVEKINENFDQIILNGGGPQGPQGLIGPRGHIGAQGIQGIRGSVWYNGTAPNFPTTAIESDYFLDNTNGDVYQYTQFGWINTGINLTGPAALDDIFDKGYFNNSTIYTKPNSLGSPVTRSMILGGNPSTGLNYVDATIDSGLLFLHRESTGAQIVFSNKDSIIRDSAILPTIYTDNVDGLYIINNSNYNALNNYKGIQLYSKSTDLSFISGRNILIEQNYVGQSENSVKLNLGIKLTDDYTTNSNSAIPGKIGILNKWKRLNNNIFNSGIDLGANLNRDNTKVIKLYTNYSNSLNNVITSTWGDNEAYIQIGKSDVYSNDQSVFGIDIKTPYGINIGYTTTSQKTSFLSLINGSTLYNFGANWKDSFGFGFEEFITFFKDDGIGTSKWGMGVLGESLSFVSIPDSITTTGISQTLVLLENKVGINNTNPSQALDIDGNIRLRNTNPVPIDSVITSTNIDGTGNWADSNSLFWKLGGNNISAFPSKTLGTTSNNNLLLVANNITKLILDTSSGITKLTINDKLLSETLLFSGSPNNTNGLYFKYNPFLFSAGDAISKIGALNGNNHNGRHHLEIYTENVNSAFIPGDITIKTGTIDNAFNGNISKIEIRTGDSINLENIDLDAGDIIINTGDIQYNKNNAIASIVESGSIVLRTGTITSNVSNFYTARTGAISLVSGGLSPKQSGLQLYQGYIGLGQFSNDWNDIDVYNGNIELKPGSKVLGSDYKTGTINMYHDLEFVGTGRLIQETDNALTPGTGVMDSINFSGRFDYENSALPSGHHLVKLVSTVNINAAPYEFIVAEPKYDRILTLTYYTTFEFFDLFKSGSTVPVTIGAMGYFNFYKATNVSAMTSEFFPGGGAGNWTTGKQNTAMNKYFTTRLEAFQSITIFLAAGESLYMSAHNDISTFGSGGPSPYIQHPIGTKLFYIKSHKIGR